MASIEIDQQTAEQIASEATARGVSVSGLLRSLLATTPTAKEQELPPLDPADSKHQTFDAEKFDRELEELAFDGPPLPENFSRADIYDDHD